MKLFFSYTICIIYKNKEQKMEETERNYCAVEANKS